MDSSKTHSGPFLKTEGIVVGITPVAEADLGLFVFTENYGVIKLRVRGIRKTKRRTRLEFEIGSVSEFEFYDHPTVQWKNIKNSKFIAAADEIRRGYQGLFILSYLCSVIKRSCPEGQVEPRIYKLLYGVLFYLKENPFHVLVLLFFKVRLLALLGVLPDFSHCSECESEVGPFAWPEPYENIFCNACWDKPLPDFYCNFLQKSLSNKFREVFAEFSEYDDLKHLDRALNSILHAEVQYEDVDEQFYKNVGF